MDSNYIALIIALTVAVIAWVVVSRTDIADQLGSLGRLIKTIAIAGVLVSAIWLFLSFVQIFLAL